MCRPHVSCFKTASSVFIVVGVLAARSSYLAASLEWARIMQTAGSVFSTGIRHSDHDDSTSNFCNHSIQSHVVSIHIIIGRVQHGICHVPKLRNQVASFSPRRNNKTQCWLLTMTVVLSTTHWLLTGEDCCTLLMLTLPNLTPPPLKIIFSVVLLSFSTVKIV